MQAQVPSMKSFRKTAELCGKAHAEPPDPEKVKGQQIPLSFELETLHPHTAIVCRCVHVRTLGADSRMK
jgi:hypothetical protein